MSEHRMHRLRTTIEEGPVRPTHVDRTPPFHTLESLKDLLDARGISLEETSVVVGNNKEFFAGKIKKDFSDSQPVTQWVIARYSYDERKIQYKIDPGQEVVAEITMSPATVAEKLQSGSESSKVVKSRPPQLYPEYFALPYNDVWPKDAAIAVIGDPYERCDRDGVTIIEYEYETEMLPDILRILLRGTGIDEIQPWLDRHYSEDIRAINAPFGPSVFPTHHGNIYGSFVGKCFELYQKIVASTLQDGQSIEVAARGDMEQLNEWLTALKNGTWETERARAFFDIGHVFDEQIKAAEEEVAEAERALRELRERVERVGVASHLTEDEDDDFVEGSIVKVPSNAPTRAESDLKHAQARLLRLQQQKADEQKGFERYVQIKNNKTRQQDFAPADSFEDLSSKIQEKMSTAVEGDFGEPILSAKEAFARLCIDYLHNLPMGYLESKIPATELSTTIDSIKRNLVLIFNGVTPARFSVLQNQLDSALDTLYQAMDFSEHPTESALLRAPFMSQMRDLQGTVISGRHIHFMEQVYSKLLHLQKYIQNFAPRVKEEQQRLGSLGIKFDEDTEYHYFRGLERAWLRADSHSMRAASRAVRLHGFFPYEMPAIDPQDRILALTSVTMHEWNTLTEDGFYNDLAKALEYLKVGGKYILGPIHQHLYFSGTADMDCDALTNALQRLATEGRIDYVFHKGMANATSDTPSDWSPDNQVLHNNESAHSLVITRLQ